MSHRAIVDVVGMPQFHLIRSPFLRSQSLAALSEQLILQGRSLLFTTCSLLVQQLLIAKRDLRLPKMIKQMSSSEGLIIDDLGYAQQGREEVEVLFTLLAQRYERGN